jgi:hypothetical protein
VALKRYLVCVLVFCSVGCATVWGQATAQINGSVKDTSGALIPGVEVSAIHVATGTRRTAVTNERGDYVLPNLPVGAYRLEASLTGFRTFVQTGITLEVDATRSVNISLEVGQVTEAVEVQANAVMVETRSTGVGEVINNTQVLQLPLVGRQSQDLIALVGGAVLTGTETATSRSFANIQRYTIAGSSDRGNNYMLDGASHNDTRGNIGLPLPFPDALQEFKIETSSLPAQYGFRSGGAISAVTKSGSNEFHGNTFWFVRNSVFNARNFFDTVKDNLKRNQYGGTAGGPIKENKLFFFGGFQGTANRRTPNASIAVVPTPAMIQGDFSKFASAACQGKNITLPAPFVNNVAPVEALNPASLKMAAKLPKPNDDCGNTTYGVPQKNDEYQYVGRLDYQLSSKHAIFGRYMADRYNAAVGTDFTNNALATTDPGKHDLFQALAYGDTITISNAMVNSFRASWNRQATLRRKPTYFDVSDLGIDAWHMSPLLDGMMFVTVSNAFVVGSRTSTPTSYRETGYQASNDLGIVKGSHQLNFGSSWQAYQQNANSLAQAIGIWEFDPIATPLSMADFMLGRLNFLQQGAPNVGPMRTKILGVYAQDSWKVRPRFTVNLGLRWEPYLTPRFANGPGGFAVNNYFNIDAFLANQRTPRFKNAPAGIFYQGDPGFPAGGNSTTVIGDRWARFAPRVGLVWDPTGDGRTAVRAGYGLFYETQIGEFGISIGQGAPWAGFTQVDNVQFDKPWANFPGGNPFPFQPGPNAPYPANGQYTVTYPGTQPPYVQQWNVAVQREIAKDWLVSATYLGNEMTHLYGASDVNPAVYIPGVGDASGNCFTTVYGRTVSLNVGAGKPCTATGGASRNARRTLTLLDPTGVLGGAKYGSVNAWDYSGTRSYNAMLLSVNKRMSGNFSLTGNYTLSHCIGTRVTTLLQGASGVGVWDDPNNHRYNRGNCNSGGSDNRHIANATAVVNMPKVANKVAGSILNNWTASGILRAKTGDWLDPVMNTDSEASGANTSRQRPDLISPENMYGSQCKTDLRTSNPTCRWLNRNAFAVPALGKLGTAGQAILLGPGAWTIDFGLSRTFKTRESQNLEFRMEASNFLNHANFLDPSANIESNQFGRIVAAADPRIIQFGLKYKF